MPKGANGAWWRFMRTTVGRITEGADVVLHAGDQVQGRWHSNNTKHRVFGPGGSARNRKRAITRAGDTIYPWLNQFWPADTIWAQGDHEIGDMTSVGIIAPTNFKYRAHWRFNDRVEAPPRRQDLRLTLQSSQTRLLGSGVIWAPTGPRANNRPVAGAVETIGTAWMDGDGWYDGDGELAEGPSYD
jgi:hypothetical protein